MAIYAYKKTIMLKVDLYELFLAKCFKILKV